MRNNPARARILRYIVNFKVNHDGCSPTVREIGEACGIPSTSVVNFYLDQLEAERRIIRPIGQHARMICIPGGYQNAVGD